ncbi:hypothetical protein [Pseudomonas laurentiana]
MSDYIHYPEFSFLARCWWQLSDHLLNPAQWDESRDKLAPLWLHTGGASIHNEHWYNYLRAEPAGLGPLQLTAEDQTAPGHVYGELFWFGAYVSGSDRHASTLGYEIRPYDRAWKPLNRIVRSNPSPLSGYAGIKDQTEAAAGSARLSSPTHLWTLAGIGNKALQRGARICNVLLLNAEGQRARRMQNRDAWLINTLSGQPGLMALEILDFAHEAREVAWGGGLRRIASRYEFKPEYSFIARARWRPDASAAAADASRDEQAGLVVARFSQGEEWNPRAALEVERGETLQEHWRSDECRPACERFWFAVYEENGAYAYEIWPLDARGRRLNFTLKHERGWSLSLAQRWAKDRAEPAFLWRLDGVNPSSLQQGAHLDGVKLKHITGPDLKMVYPQGQRNLDTVWLGGEGSLELEVLEVSARC